MSTDIGIRPRHVRACPQRADRRASCRCTPTFEANVYDAKAQKRITKAFATKSAARRWREDARVALRSGKLSAERGPLLKDAVEEWLDGLQAGHITTRSGDLYKPAAVRGYRSSLYLRAVPALGHLRLEEVTTRHVQRLVDDLQKCGFASATIDADITPLKALYRRAVGRGEVRVNPTVGIEKPAVRTKARRVVPHTAAEAMIAVLDPDERALWATAFYAGPRMGELSALARDDIDLAAGTIHVHRNWDAVEGYVAVKNRKPRTVPIAAVLRDYLDEHLLSIDADEHIFGTPRFVNRATERARKCWQERALPVLDLHEARHTYASFAIAAGLNVKTVSTYLGHATIQITLDLYGHLFPGHEDEAATMLDTYFARQAGGSAVAQTVAHPEQMAV
jgi:integrase